MDFVSYIILLGIVQGLFIGLLLVTRKGGNRKANRILGIIFFTISLSISYYFFYSINLFMEYPHLQKITFPTTFLFGPLLYFYAKVQTDKSFRFDKKQLLHFIPFILVILSNIPFYMQSSEYKLDYFLQKGIYKKELDGIQSLSQILQISIYIIVIKILISKHIQKIKNTMSVIDNVSLRWLSVSLNYFIAIFVVIVNVLFFSLGSDKGAFYHISIPLLVTLFIFTLGYSGLKQPEIILMPESEDNEKKYEKSGLSDEKGEEYLKQLLDLMETKKPFLESDLTLLKLAENLGISSNHLSQIINEKLNQNFYDFVNKYRVENAKSLLVDPSFDSKTIFAIALESGFNSKSAFNTCFKKYTNQTPSEYKKHIVFTSHK